MAKNLGRKFATMSEDERRRFALQQDEGCQRSPRDHDHRRCIRFEPT